IMKIPGLSAYGIGFPRHDDLKPHEHEKWFRREQAELLNDVDGCSRAEAWLRDKPKRKYVNWRHSSYGLRRIAEKEIGYVSHGAFIAAAIHCGFPYQILPHSPNPSFGICESALQARKLRHQRIPAVPGSTPSA